MDVQFWILLLKIIIFLPFVILLIFLSAKLGGKKLQDLQNGKYMKVLERLPLSKENSLIIVKVGEQAYVMTSTSQGVKILLELTQEELLKVQSQHKVSEYKSIKDVYEKLKMKKEERDD